MELKKGGKVGFSPQQHGGKMWYSKNVVLKEEVRLAGWEGAARQEGKFRLSVGAI